jgi:hypothetical protein
MIRLIVSNVIKTWFAEAFINNIFDRFSSRFINESHIPEIGDTFSYIIEIYGEVIYKDCTITNVKESVSSNGSMYYFIFFEYKSAWTDGGINVTESIKSIDYDLDDLDDDGIGELDDGVVVDTESETDDFFESTSFPNDNLTIRLMEDQENLVGMNLHFMRLVK